MILINLQYMLTVTQKAPLCTLQEFKFARTTRHSGCGILKRKWNDCPTCDHFNLVPEVLRISSTRYNSLWGNSVSCQPGRVTITLFVCVTGFRISSGFFGHINWLIKEVKITHLQSAPPSGEWEAGRADPHKKINHIYIAGVHAIIWHKVHIKSTPEANMLWINYG